MARILTERVALDELKSSLFCIVCREEERTMHRIQTFKTFFFPNTILTSAVNDQDFLE